jgi:hypothetical protein
MAQNAADTSALAAAKSYGSSGDSTTATTTAKTIASNNGFATNYTSCSGVAKTDGVTVNIPPASGTYSGQASYAEVIVQRPMKTSFSQLVGQSCWMVSARAVASISSTEVATCNFCSLNNTSQNHTLVLKNSATLRVDGGIYVNSSSGGYTPGSCTTKSYQVCGDGFDVFGDGGTISAQTISVHGGWETHDQNIAVADGLATGCVDHPNPPSQSQTANVCVHMPVLTDPLNDTSHPGSVVHPPTAGAAPVAGSNGCPSGATVPTGTAGTSALLTITNGNKTICPGTYWGGLKATGGTITMIAGTYIMVGGGFQITGNAAIDGRDGVFIYSEGGGSATQTTTTANDLVPDAIAGHTNLKQADLTASALSVPAGVAVTFTMKLTPNGGSAPAPTGTIDFYDGSTVICAAAALVQPNTTKNPAQATCTTAFDVYGTRAISAVYAGDSYYNPIGDTMTMPVTGTGSAAATGPITIDSTGKVDLYGPKSGTYSGLTLFQERSSNLTVTIAPGDSHASHCAANFMTAGVPPDTSAVPDPCGDIGGLQGTVYAPNNDALVLITASGMANLQVISGVIEVDSGANSRFGYDASVFANSSVHLVE